MPRLRSKRPSWEKLFGVALHQEGMFTTRQAGEAGYSAQLLGHYVHQRRIACVRRGIYRIVQFKTGGNIEFVDAWLWSKRQGVLSHRTALGLLGLADIVRWPIDLTVPPSWSSRRLQIPDHIMLYYAEVPASDRTWRGPVPVTTARRTFSDGGEVSLSAEALREAIDRALERGWVAESDVAAIELGISSKLALMRTVSASGG